MEFTEQEIAERQAEAKKEPVTIHSTSSMEEVDKLMQDLGISHYDPNTIDFIKRESNDIAVLLAQAKETKRRKESSEKTIIEIQALANLQDNPQPVEAEELIQRLDKLENNVKNVANDLQAVSQQTDTIIGQARQRIAQTNAALAGNTAILDTIHTRTQKLSSTSSAPSPAIGEHIEEDNKQWRAQLSTQVAYQVTNIGPTSRKRTYIFALPVLTGLIYGIYRLHKYYEKKKKVSQQRSTATPASISTADQMPA